MKKSITPDKEAVLLAALVNHNCKAYSELYDRYATALLGVITRMVHDEATAQDLLQETFIKVWKNVHLHNPAKGRLFTWLLKVARNTALDHLRKHQVTQPIDLQLAIGELTFTDITQIGLRETVLAVLEPHYRPIIDLIYFQGYTQQETANHLSLPLGTVKTRVRLALAELKNTFAAEG